MLATLAEDSLGHLDLVILGSANLDLVAESSHLPSPGETVIGFSYHEYPGGKGLNQAVAAARAGAQVQLWGQLGDDAAGRALREVVRSEGIDDQLLFTHPVLPTGRAMIWVDRHAENSILVIPGANSGVQPEFSRSSVASSSLSAARVVLAQLEVPVTAVAELMSTAGEFGCLRIVNPAPAAELTEDLLRNCEILTPNEGELVALGGRQRLHRLGVRVVIETRGARGVHCSIADASREISESWTEPAPVVTAIDTTGAGDVFSGYLSAVVAGDLKQGHDPLALDRVRLAVRTAVIAAAIAVTRKGAVPSIPHRGEVDQILSGSATIG